MTTELGMGRTRRVSQRKALPRAWTEAIPAAVFAVAEVGMLKSFRDLEVWKKAHALVLEVYRLTNQFPRSEQFGVTGQLRRATYSVPTNIAEGFGRRSTKELLQSLTIANGSLEETRYFLLLGRDLKYLPPTEFDKLDRDIVSVGQMIAGLVRSLKNRSQSLKESTKKETRTTGHGSRQRKRGANFHG